MNDLEALRKQYTAPDLATASSDELRAYAERLEQGVIDVVRVKNTMSEALTLEQERRAAAEMDVFLVVVNIKTARAIAVFTDKETAIANARRAGKAIGAIHEGNAKELSLFIEPPLAGNSADVYVERCSLNDPRMIEAVVEFGQTVAWWDEVTK